MLQKRSFPPSQIVIFRRLQRRCLFLKPGLPVYCLLFCLPKNCTNQIKSNYLNSHGEEAQEKPGAYKEWAPSVR